MTTEEHLKKIVAKCRELLAIAEKRTQGKWKLHPNYWTEGMHPTLDGEKCLWLRSYIDVVRLELRRKNDAIFISSCSESAEAGWRATIAACELAIPVSKCCDSFIRESEHAQSVMALAEQLIAAWPKELL